MTHLAASFSRIARSSKEVHDTGTAPRQCPGVPAARIKRAAIRVFCQWSTRPHSSTLHGIPVSPCSENSPPCFLGYPSCFLLHSHSAA